MAGARGFTVIEMIIVIAVIGVMAIVAVPYFLGMSPRARLKSAARDIASNMQLTKMKAIRDSSAWVVQFDTGTSKYRVLSDDGGDDSWGTGDDTVYKAVSLSDYPGVSFGQDCGTVPDEPNPGSTDGVSFAGDRVIFNPDGTTGSGTVYLKNGSDTFAVGSLAATGRIKIWHNYGSGWQE